MRDASLCGNRSLKKKRKEKKKLENVSSVNHGPTTYAMTASVGNRRAHNTREEGRGTSEAASEREKERESGVTE